MRTRSMFIFLLLIGLVVPGSASAARNLEATFQDDNELIYTTDKKREAALDTLDDLGVDRIRASVVWEAIAPNPGSRNKPSFESGDPAAYGDARWRNLDSLVIGAAERGIRMNFNLTAPAPLWATARAPRDDIAETYKPDTNEWVKFVIAAGLRYSGDFVREDGTQLPRVDYWSIWNEPNHSNWLTPTWEDSVPQVAAEYRRLLDAAYVGLGLSGHAKDTILIGETAPSGQNRKSERAFMKPLVFVRALYCLNSRNARLSGDEAKRLGCPSSGREMVEQHPALFKATGYAHHPYTSVAPTVKTSDEDSVAIGSLSRITRVLDLAQRRYGQRRKLPLYLTEFGYQTPPDTVGVPLPLQAEFINESEFIAWKNKRVRTLSQFLLVDDSLKDPQNFQSGLISRKGRKPKPSFDAYRLPLVVKGKRLWGVLRPADPGQRATAEVQFRRKGGSWRTIKTVKSRGRYNWWRTRLKVPPKGQLRVSYDGHTSRVARSR